MSALADVTDELCAFCLSVIYLFIFTWKTFELDQHISTVSRNRLMGGSGNKERQILIEYYSALNRVKKMSGGHFTRVSL